MIVEFESRILALADGMVEYTSGDELFANGYLRGHLIPAVVELDAGKDYSTRVSHTNATSSLKKAINAGELPPCDQALVKEMWDILSQKATQ